MTTVTAVRAFGHRAVSRAGTIQILAASAGVTALLVLLALWLGDDQPSSGYRCRRFGVSYAPPFPHFILGVTDLLALGLLAAGLFVVAPAVAAAAVATERRSGTLDQLRTTPLAPRALLAGFLVGAPVRVYLFLLGPLALHLACGALGALPLDTLLATLTVLAVGGLAAVLLGITTALAPRRETGGALLPVAVACGLFVTGLLSLFLPSELHSAPWAFLHPAGGLSAALLAHDSVWRRLLLSAWRREQLEVDVGCAAVLSFLPLLATLGAALAAAGLARASCRRLADPERPLLSRPLALLLATGTMAAIALPALAPARHGTISPGPLLALLLPTVLVMFLAALLSAPGPAAWQRARRAARRTPWHHDDAGPYRLVLALLLVAALVGGVLLQGANDPLDDHHVVALGWLALLALSLPELVLLVVRRASVTSGWASGTLAAAHLASQAVAILLSAERSRHLDHPYVQLAAVVAVAMPITLRVLRYRAERHMEEGARPPALPGEPPLAG